MQTRVGVATDLVVVGDLIGSGASQEQAIVGETPNLAARLQSIAEPNTVVIAESTRRLVGILFELVDLGPTLNAFGGVASRYLSGMPVFACRPFYPWRFNKSLFCHILHFEQTNNKC